MTYQWWVGKCNELTLHVTDSQSGTPEDKYSACQVEPIADQLWAERHMRELYTQLKDRLFKEASHQDAPAEPGEGDAPCVEPAREGASDQSDVTRAREQAIAEAEKAARKAVEAQNARLALERAWGSEETAV